MLGLQQSKGGGSIPRMITKTPLGSLSHLFSPLGHQQFCSQNLVTHSHVLKLLHYLQVISGLSIAVKGMKGGSARRVVIPPSEGYQSVTDEPVPPNVRNCNYFW